MVWQNLFVITLFEIKRYTLIRVKIGTHSEKFVWIMFFDVFLGFFLNNLDKILFLALACNPKSYFLRINPKNDKPAVETIYP